MSRKKASDNVNKRKKDEEDAKLRILHALLSDKYKSHAHTQNLINESLEIIKEEHVKEVHEVSNRPHRQIQLYSQSIKKWLTRRQISSYIGFASAFLVFFAFLFFTPSNNTAIAAINHIIHRSSSIGDRKYEIRVSKIKGRVNSKPYNHLTSAELFLRDMDQFVLIGYRENGSTHIKGKNSIGSWAINGRGEAIVESETSKVKLPFSGNTGTLMMLDLMENLETLKQNYELTLEAPPLPPGYTANLAPSSERSNSKLSRITARKLNSTVKGAKYITILFDTETHTLQHMVYDRVHLSGENDRVTVTLSLVSDSPLALDFFDMHSHM